MYQDTEREVLGSSVGSVGSHEGRELMEGLRAAGLCMEADEPSPQAAGEARPQTLSGMSVVVSGTLESFSRDEAREAIVARGGSSPGSVSGRTAALVVGADPGRPSCARPNRPASR